MIEFNMGNYNMRNITNNNNVRPDKLNLIIVLPINAIV